MLLEERAPSSWHAAAGHSGADAANEVRCASASERRHHTATGVAALGCTPTDVIGARSDQALYPLPDPQRMPTQEPGAAVPVPTTTS